ncbi:sulfite reductase [NADPH] flavoprotein component [Elsinoe australis]|uniref:assimilatory sulfite reductase (NADPH) n=1 Tax=Elsinoe australis TaxID=40998 RepID=A0A4V6DTN0_9PEZI|nr:sulfite reductase [NADPH] flavoprotein component [Elsinoe australis]
MHLQQDASSGPAAPQQQPSSQTGKTPKSQNLPFGQNIALSNISGPTYLTGQSLVQQVAYSLSDKIFSYSPETFDLDIAAKYWQSQGEQNAHGYTTGVQSTETRTGAGSIALGYMFSKDFDLTKRHIPQSIVASSGSLPYLRPVLDELSLLYHAANPTVAHVAAVDYTARQGAGLVTDYTAAMNTAEELGLGLVSSASTFEMQHMALFATIMSSVMPSIHVYDGMSVGRETTRVIDVLDRASLHRTYKTILEQTSEADKKRVDNGGRVSKLLKSFNEELGTDYKTFEYKGHPEPETVVVVFGTVEASLTSQIAEAMAKTGIKIGAINVRVYRPFVEEEFLEVLAPTVQHIAVLGQVKDQVNVQDSSEHSALYSDVLASLAFATHLRSQPAVYDFKYPRLQIWTPSNTTALIQQIAQKLPAAPEEEDLFDFPTGEIQQYSFWDLDDSKAADAPLTVGQLLSGDSKLNVNVRTSHDNLIQGGVMRTDIRSSTRSIEAAYSVISADVAYVGSEKLLKEYDVVQNIKEGGVAIVRLEGFKKEELEKRLSVQSRKSLALAKIQLIVFDPTQSQSVVDEPSLESYLLQLAFLQTARSDLYESGVKKLAGGDDALEKLANDLDNVLYRAEVPEEWLTVEPEADKPVPMSQDLNLTSFAPVDKSEVEDKYDLKDWTSVAKAFAFREAYGTSVAVRPDLGIKTAVVHVKEHRRLTPETYDRNIFHIEFDLGDTGLKYDIGEALGVHAENDATEVKNFIEWYGLNPDHVVEVPSREDPNVVESRTVYQSLRQNIDIFGRPPKRFYEALSEFASDEKEKTQLLLLGTGGNQESQVEFKRRAEVDTVTYADILLEFPSAKPSFHDVVKIIAPMKRREYSIASSQKVTPNSVSLLIVTVNWVDPKGRDRFGQATRYLNALPVGAPVTVSVKPSVMKLPPKSTAPIIMAGLGTGLAPFRAFVQERAWQKQQGMEIGSVLLYMGSRHQREEYLYGEEWEAYRDAGIITLMGCAFSRDQAQKIYIQDRMRETLTDIRKAYLNEEGAFYLCGPTWPVPDVTNVLEEAIEVEGKVEGKKVDPKRKIEELKDELRYVLEVY